MDNDTTRTTLAQRPIAPIGANGKPGRVSGTRGSSSLAAPFPRFDTLADAPEHLRREADPVYSTRRLFGLHWDSAGRSLCPFCHRRSLRVTRGNRLRCDLPGGHRRSWSLVKFTAEVARTDWGMALALLLSVERERQMGGEGL